MSRSELPEACGIEASEVGRIEAGKEGLAGGLQDYLAEQVENVCELASEQSEFLKKRDT
ncbi:MAG: hypothetical protein GTO55_01960 [Armatimonadetes bacterium]|nr:hypothetical protein [Armatimonadota bacterium]NIM23044.1 hypothetical protein [Armatimonadota bacterium]NIM66912.1 hypothetical protein [Armatimonadota bacterium]NIM75446.1 hypothetical protein [Armatimonadota bacterium]NIN05103.1 hypothetical protein [Armatimonadota bacterium]